EYYAGCEESYDAEDNGMYTEPDFNTEEYSAISENSFQSVTANPLSTFSADVDTASYSNLRRIIRGGGEIPQDAVRIEEMINYFRYRYPEPQAGEPFSVTTEIADCPWNADTKLMMVGMKAKDIDMQQRKPMNLVFLIDVSGSMYSADKLPLVQKAFCMLTEELNENDRVSIVTYAGADRVELEGAAGNEGIRIREAIEMLEAGGSTAGAAGINTAYDIAQKYFIEGGNNRIILATDGDLNVGVSSEAGLKKLVEKQRKNGVFLSVLGFGTGNIKDNKMETLADNGNGNYAYIDSEAEARRVLVEEMGGTLETVAKDVKFQVEFNPAYIKGYRLIGYENRMLAAEDFADDTKDAGEIGAGHTVTALYEIADLNSTMEFASSDLKYSEGGTTGTENGEYCTVSVRYKEPDGDESRLLSYPVAETAYTQAMSDNMRFASAVAAFGLVLRDSEYKGSASRDMVLGMITENDTANDQYKQEFAELVSAVKLPE
ncbi:MAG: von Willebrand factor type A domain-containing protein, partial [Oscillospiraceae bacterium]|nr:von Willebrand factor type A domain-containing protein [Oscillospiraceae bacterium]